MVPRVTAWHVIYFGVYSHTYAIRCDKYTIQRVFPQKEGTGVVEPESPAVNLGARNLVCAIEYCLSSVQVVFSGVQWCSSDA